MQRGEIMERTELQEIRDEHELTEISKRKKNITTPEDYFPQEDDLGIYSSREREEALEEDEISAWEAGFMQGWDEAA